MDAWERIGNALMRAALADAAASETSKRVIEAMRTIEDTRRILSTTSVRRSRFNLECLSWFAFV